MTFVVRFGLRSPDPLEQRRVAQLEIQDRQIDLGAAELVDPLGGAIECGLEATAKRYVRNCSPIGARIPSSTSR